RAFMKKHIYIVLGFAISIVLLYFSLRGIHLREIWAILKKTNLALAFTPLIFIATAISLSSYRWARIAGTTVRFGEAFTANLIGMFHRSARPVFRSHRPTAPYLDILSQGEPASRRFQRDFRRHRHARALRS